MHMTHNTAVNAVAVTEGINSFESQGYTSYLAELAARMEQGFVEFYSQVAEVAELVTEAERRLGEYLDNTGYGWPGVFSYEVAEEVGRWFAAYIDREGDFPRRKVIWQEVLKEVEAFCQVEPEAYQAFDKTIPN